MTILPDAIVAATATERPPIFADGGTALDDLAALANASHAAAETCARSAIHHARDCGQTLMLAKSKVQHGEWVRWIRENCQFSERQAQRYMRIAVRWSALVEREVGPDAKTTRVSDLPIEGLSIREALRELAGGKDGKASDHDVYQEQTCPSCGAHLAEHRPGAMTCLECFGCKVYPVPGSGRGGQGARHYPLMDAQAAWQRMSELDRRQFLVGIGQQSPATSADDALQKCIDQRAEFYGDLANDRSERMLAKIKAEMSAACPKGGDHDWTQDDDGAYCAKCLEPAGGAK